MSENPNKEIDKEKAEQAAIEKENKILSLLLPITGVIALILGGVGIGVTVGNEEAVGIFVFSIVLTVLGLLGALYGVVVIIRIKKPDFLKRKKKEETDTIAD